MSSKTRTTEEYLDFIKYLLDLTDEKFLSLLKEIMPTNDQLGKIPEEGKIGKEKLRLMWDAIVDFERNRRSKRDFNLAYDKNIYIRAAINFALYKLSENHPEFITDDKLYSFCAQFEIVLILIKIRHYINGRNKCIKFNESLRGENTPYNFQELCSSHIIIQEYDYYRKLVAKIVCADSLGINDYKRVKNNPLALLNSILNIGGKIKFKLEAVAIHKWMKHTLQDLCEKKILQNFNQFLSPEQYLNEFYESITYIKDRIHLCTRNIEKFSDLTQIPGLKIDFSGNNLTFNINYIAQNNQNNHIAYYDHTRLSVIKIGEDGIHLVTYFKIV